jgi:hypothetical protein
MTERNSDDLNDTYYEQVADIAADMADNPDLSDNLKEVIENEFPTPEKNIDDLENHTYEEQIEELAANMEDDPEQSDNLTQIMENEFRTPDRNDQLEEL